MNTQKNETNIAIISGRMDNHPVYVETNYWGEKLYKGYVFVKRFSDYEDQIPVIIPEHLLNGVLNLKNSFVYITGHFQSRNKLVPNSLKRKLELYLYTTKLEVLDEEPLFYTNKVSLIASICKPPVYRETPLGKKITDVIFAVNRGTPTFSDYIPSIVWGQNALYTSTLSVGTKVKIEGRIQSREYIKRLSETDVEMRTAYELSVCSIYKL